MNEITKFILIALFSVSINCINAQEDATNCNSCAGLSASEAQQLIDNYKPHIVTSGLKKPANLGVSAPWKTPGTLKVSKIQAASQLKSVSESSSSVQTNLGKEFWLAFPPNYDQSGTLSLDITSRANTSGTVSIPGMDWSENFTITANQVIRITVPIEAIAESNRVAYDKGIHVVAEDAIAITGTHYRMGSAESYLGIPVKSLGKEYLCLGWERGARGQGVVSIVSTTDNTIIDVTGPVTITGITLNRGQVYGFEASLVSGSYIRATNDVAVFSSNDCANIGAGACDHIVEQLPPLSSFGKEFVSQ
ncbi:MAG: IgGFc-binding protein [Marinilabiliaceae bacterium]|nr:IgGFc-binding protein [Marinilabiliaceae bacterium]